MPKQRSHLYKILPYLLRYKWRVGISLALIILARVLSVANPYVIKEIVDTLSAGATAAFDIRYLFILVVLFFVFRWGTDILAAIKDYVFARVEVEVRKLISLDIFSHLLSLPVEFHADQSTGGVTRKISRGTSALTTLSFFFAGNILPTLVEALLIVAVFIQLFPPLFTVVFAAFVAVYVLFTIVITNRRQALLLASNRHDDRGSEQSVDALMNYETVKYFTNEEFEYKRYSSALEKWTDIAIQSSKRGADLNLGQGLIITAGLTALLGLAVREYLAGNATLGDFVLITTYLNRIAIPLSFLGSLYRRLKESLANLDEMFKLFDTTSTVVDKPGALELENPAGRVTFKDVSFGYAKDRTVLKGVSIDVPARTSVALVGASGSGKSTISKLLLRFYDVEKGSVSIDGIDVRDMTQTSLRRNIGVVAQDTTLFNDTIFANIQYGKPEASEDEVIAAAKVANIHAFIEDLPQKYETRVGERGVKLSGGEKQRVAIARMLLKNPPILLFDEATASLDSKNEKMIQDAIKTLSTEGRTTIVIAHRLSTIVDFHNIVVMDEGKVVQMGTHEELLRTCGVYQRLWSIQKGSHLN